MGFQSAVQLQQGFGVPGELFTDSPYRSQSFIINSASAAYNIVGATAYTITSQGVAQAGSGGTLGFAGILADPKIYANYGISGNALAPTLVLANYTQADLVSMGTMIVTLPGAAAIGDWVVYDNTTGALSTVAAGSGSPGSGKSWAHAFVDYFTVSGSGLAVITLNPFAVTA